MQKKIADFEYPTLNPHIECNTYYLFMTTKTPAYFQQASGSFLFILQFHSMQQHPIQRRVR